MAWRRRSLAVTRPEVARGLAAALLASDWSREDMVAHAQEALGLRATTRPRWLLGLARRAREAFPLAPHHDARALETFVSGDPGLERALRRRVQETGRPVRVRTLFLTSPAMRPERPFPVPDLPTDAALAAWLGLSVADLAWFADAQGWLVRAPLGPLQHYEHRWLPKRDGSRRLIESPKATLKALQRRLLDRLLAHVPPHEAAHGFRPGRSALTFAAPHAGKDLVLRMDLRDFFPSISAARVAALFRALGYARPVAWTLTCLATTRTPLAVLEGAGLAPQAEDALRRRHLPQGAPTSPALANLAAFGLDVRLSAAAASVGAAYTRYADDLAFSGDGTFRRQADRFRLLVVRIAEEEGFTVRWEKNRWMRPSASQRLAGLVVNDRPRPPRAAFKLLEAILTNCARHGPAGQDREGHPDFRAHLRGRVAWFEHADPPRGARLRALFEQIAW